MAFVLSALRTRKLYTARATVYDWWMAVVRHQQGLKGLFKRCGCLRSGFRILDAGCGSGATTFALTDALRDKRMGYREIHAFDLTPAMLEQFKSRLQSSSIPRLKLREADVLDLDKQLPESWTGYDLIVSTSMLEYVPSAGLERALAFLHKRTASNGRVLVVITRKNILSRAVIEWGWQARGHTAAELRTAFAHAGFLRVQFLHFPVSHFWLNSTNHVVIAS